MLYTQKVLDGNNFMRELYYRRIRIYGDSGVKYNPSATLRKSNSTKKNNA